MRFVSLNAGGESMKKEIRNGAGAGRGPIQEDIDEVLRQLHESSERFDLVCDDDLIESIIYEQNALMARYRYLLKAARRDGQAAPGEQVGDCAAI